MSRQYLFPRAAVKSNHKFGGLKYLILFSPSAGGLKRMQSTPLGMKSRFGRLAPSQGSRGESPPCLFQLPEASHIPASF